MCERPGFSTRSAVRGDGAPNPPGGPEVIALSLHPMRVYGDCTGNDCACECCPPALVSQQLLDNF